MSRAIVMLSGGIDSAVALAWTQRHYQELLAISFQYHLRPFREQLAMYRLLQHLPARLIEVPMPYLREIVDAKHNLPDHVPQGYVSNRNLIFYSIACHFAEIHECDAIVGGHTAEDKEDFPDAAPLFFQRFQSLANEALLLKKIRIELPLANWTKRQVIQKAKEWNVPLELTWSCYWDAPAPCGQCISCLERKEALGGFL